MNELATGADVRRACQELELKMDEVVDSINTLVFLALHATLNV
jgi:hypothetical protein